MANVDNRNTGPQDRSATGERAQSLNVGYQGKLAIDESLNVDNSKKVSGNVGTTSGDGNTVLGAGAMLVHDVSGDVVGRALDSLDLGTTAGFGLGAEALKIVADFGSSTIQNTNARADSALAAVERLAATPTERVGSGAQDSRVMLLILGGVAVLALLLGRGAGAKAKA